MYKNRSLLVLLAFAVVVASVAAVIQSSQAALPSRPAVTIGPTIGITITPTPAPTPVHVNLTNMTISPVVTINNTSYYNHITDGFYTTSSLLYVVGPGNITVIEADTNKVVDVIYLDKYELRDAVVSPDYRTLYVLYHGVVDPSKVSAGYDSDHANFILTIDLDTKQIVDDTWHRDYPDFVIGSAEDLVLSADGRYLYYGNNQGDSAGILFEYDTVLHKYTRGVITNQYYGSINDVSSNIYDLAITADGKRLYFADKCGRLTFVNLPDLSLNMWIRTGLADYHPWMAAVSSDGNQAYLAGESFYANGGYSMVSMDVPAILAKEENTSSVLKFSSVADVLRLGPDQGEIYVLEPDKKLVFGIDIDSPALYWTYPTGNMPEDFVFSNDGKWLYIYSSGNNYISVYDRYSRQKASGSPIRLGPDRGLDNSWHFGSRYKLVMGPSPDGYVFVNDSAYRANLMLKLASVVQVPGTSYLPGALELNKSSSTSSSFYFDTSLGKTIRFNLGTSGDSATATHAPGYDLSLSGAIPITPFPAESDEIVSQENQTQQNTGSGNKPAPSAGASSTPDNAGNMPGPVAGGTLTPGFEAIAGLACLIIATIVARRKIR